MRISSVTKSLWTSFLQQKEIEKVLPNSIATRLKLFLTLFVFQDFFRNRKSCYATSIRNDQCSGQQLGGVQRTQSQHIYPNTVPSMPSLHENFVPQASSNRPLHQLDSRKQIYATHCRPSADPCAEQLRAPSMPPASRSTGPYSSPPIGNPGKAAGKRSRSPSQRSTQHFPAATSRITAVASQAASGADFMSERAASAQRAAEAAEVAAASERWAAEAAAAEAAAAATAAAAAQAAADEEAAAAAAAVASSLWDDGCYYADGGDAAAAGCALGGADSLGGWEGYAWEVSESLSESLSESFSTSPCDGLSSLLDDQLA
jgi:hypothetical protein